MISATHCTASPGSTRRLGIDLANSLRPGQVIALCGDLGSGKTTLTQGIARGLGVTRRITSPTFSISKIYPTSKPNSFFYHFDLYRLGQPVDPEAIGLLEALNDPTSIVVIEWPETVTAFLPPHLHIRFDLIDPQTRSITIKPVNHESLP